MCFGAWLFFLYKWKDKCGMGQRTETVIEILDENRHGPAITAGSFYGRRAGFLAQSEHHA